MGFFKNYAKGRRPLGIMNGLETRFAKYLEELRVEGELEWWAYEPVKLHLAQNTSYTPDFLAMTKDLELQVFEVKGRWLPESRTKCKCANEKFPFHFFGAMWNSREKRWDLEEFK